MSLTFRVTGVLIVKELITAKNRADSEKSIAHNGMSDNMSAPKALSVIRQLLISRQILQSSPTQSWPASTAIKQKEKSNVSRTTAQSAIETDFLFLFIRFTPFKQN